MADTALVIEDNPVVEHALPTGDAALHPEYVAAPARLAYIWGYPMVNMANRRDRMSQAPAPGRMGEVLPAGPTGRIGMLNECHPANLH